MVFGESPNHCYATFFLETPYVTWQGFSEMVILTGSDFQRINFSRKNLLSLKSLEFFFFFLRVKKKINEINNNYKETELQIKEVT